MTQNLATKGSTVDVQVGNINSELNRLWKEQPQKNQIRACLFNLIIFSHEPERAAYLHQIVQAILEKFPCRIIFIQAVKESTEDYLRATVSNAIIGQGDALIACDQINIDVTDSLLKRVPFVIYPILVPDLPVYLVWGQNPTSEKMILPELSRFASRLIFDSECADNLPEFSRKITQMLDKTNIEVRDVKWASIGGWREILTHLFDSPQRLDLLKTCKDLQITYNGRKSVFATHTEIPAIYLQAWLAAQLGWEFRTAETKDELRHFLYHNGQEEVRVTLIPEDNRDLNAGSITSVQIGCAGDHSFTLIRKERQPRVAVHIASQDQCEMPFFLPLNELKNSTAFMTEIFYRKTSNHYRNMLMMIARFNNLGS